MSVMLNDLEIGFLGSGLQRPECVLATANGRLYASDWRGGVAVLEPDGGQYSILPTDSSLDIRPNGICLLPDGSFLLAHLGDEDGGVYRITAAGEVEPYLLEVDGAPLPPSNYVHYDARGRVWVTVSTRLMPRAKGYRGDNADGFVVLVDGGGARIVADNLGYTNECVVHPDGERLFVNETFCKRLTSFDIAADGSLSNRTTVAEFGAGTFPDGLVFDAEGGVWITSIVSNRVIRVAPDGAQDVILEDNDPQFVAAAEAAYQEGAMGRPHLDTSSGNVFRNISSLAFGGAGLRTGYLGCLLGDAIASFSSPVAGHPPAYWTFAGPERRS